MDGDSWAVDVIQALAIPATIVVAVLVLRRPIAEFLGSIGGRVSKLSVGQFSVELSEATEIRPSWTLEMNGQHFDVRQLSPANIFDSYADSLLRQLAEPGSLDYVVVDLAAGKSWLTTRLFLFAELLARMRGLRAFVFVHSTSTTDRSFIGVAPASAVRWSLAMAYPELDVQFAQACSQSLGVVLPGPMGRVAVSTSGALEQWRAGQIARTFLDGLQQQAPPVTDTDAWVELPSAPVPGSPIVNPTVWERARWIDVGDALRIFDGVLSREMIVEADDRDIDRAEQVKNVVAANGDFVAVVRHERFDRLIDRRQVVEQVARRAVST